MVGHLTNPMFQQCSVIITHAGMTWHYIMVFCRSAIRSSFPRNYSRVWWENFPKASTVVKVWCVATEKWCIGLECEEQLSKKVPTALCVLATVSHYQKNGCCLMNFHIPLSQDLFKQGGTSSCYCRPLQWLVWFWLAKWGHYCSKCYFSYWSTFRPL